MARSEWTLRGWGSLDDVRAIVPLGSRRLSAKVRLPGSKSITNRALLLAALCQGTSVLRGALRSDDSEVFVQALSRLGIAVEEREDELTVHGVGGGSMVPAAEIDVRLSGTSARFICPLLALSHGRYRVDGTERMRQRPMGELVTALRELGVDVTGGPNLPLMVTGHGRLRGGVWPFPPVKRANTSLECSWWPRMQTAMWNCIRKDL